MSITLSSAFTTRKFMGGADAFLVVQITNNAGTAFLFAESEIYPSSGTQINGLLYDISPITHGYDPYSCEYQPGHVTISIANLWSRRTTAGVWHRASDYMADGTINGLWGQQCRVYLFPGAGHTTVASSLMVFDGSITGMSTQGEDRLTIQADEIWDAYFNIQIPQRRADRTTWRNLPTENINKTLPIVYGPHNELAALRNTGFAVGMRVDRWTWVFGDHVGFAFYDEPRPSSAANGSAYSSTTKAMWIYLPAVESWARSYAGVTFNENNSGRMTAVIDPDTAGWDVYLYPTAGTPTSTATDSGNNVGPEAAFDYDTDTKLSIIAESTTSASIIFEWRQNGGQDNPIGDGETPLESATANDAGNSVAAFPGPSGALAGFDMYASKPGGITISSAAIEYWGGTSWHSLSTSVDVATANMIHYTSGVDGVAGSATGFFAFVHGSSDSMRWHLATGRSPQAGTSPDQKPFKIRITFTGSGWTANSTVVAYIHECRLVFSCQTPRDKSQVIGKKAVNYQVDQRDLLGRKTGRKIWKVRYEEVTDIASNVFGASLQGREYGTWISDHSAPADVVGDQISTAPGVIESLLCDEIGVATSAINMTSFDDVYNAADDRGCVVTLLPGSATNLKALVDKLCFEHRMVLYRGRGTAVKFTLVDARGRSTTAGTILPQDLAETPEISMTPFNPTNLITFWYRKLPHDGQYFKSETVEDTTSTTEYGDIAEDIYLETIKNTAFMDPIRDHLIASNYLSSRNHHIVTFRTVGLRWVELELGDVIEFSADLDDQMLLFGQSWNGVQFVIYEASVLPSPAIGMEFRAMTISPEPASELGSGDDIYTGTDSIEGVITGYSFTMPASGQIERLVAYIDYGSSAGLEHTMKAAIYTKVATPALVTGSETEEITVQTTGDATADDGWVAFSYSGAKPTLAAGDYYACFWADSTTTTTSLRGESSGGAGNVKKTSAYGSWPSTLTTPTLDADAVNNVKVFYTPA